LNRDNPGRKVDLSSLLRRGKKRILQIRRKKDVRNLPKLPTIGGKKKTDYLSFGVASPP